MRQGTGFHALLADRYEGTTTILASNLDFDEWGSLALPRNEYGYLR